MRRRTGTRPTVENPAYGRFLRRILAAYTRRCGNDLPDLAGLATLAAEVDRSITWACAVAHENGASLAEIARELGITKQAVAKRLAKE